MEVLIYSGPILLLEISARQKDFQQMHFMDLEHFELNLIACLEVEDEKLSTAGPILYNHNCFYRVLPDDISHSQPNRCI